MQGMARPIQFVGDIKRRRLTLAALQVVDDHLQMSSGLLGKDIQQYRIHFQRRLLCDFLRQSCRLDRQYGRIRITFCKCVSPCDQQTDVGGRIRANLQLLDELRHCGRHLDNEIDHRRRTHECPIDQTIQEIFNAPAIFANSLGANHPATALECVVCTTNSN